MDAILCSACFADNGLKFDAIKLGQESSEPCPNCKSSKGVKLDKATAQRLASRFFVRGSLHKCEYGGAPVIQFNEHQNGKSQVAFSEKVQKDADLIGKVLGIGFFLYGPRLWMVGEIEPLADLQEAAKRPDVIKRILAEYPAKNLSTDHLFFRLRRNPKRPHLNNEYDSPTHSRERFGRLDSSAMPVLYGSPDLQTCIHECRTSADDEIYVASLRPKRELKLIDLTALVEDGQTEFESLDMAVHFLFLAGEHSYEISRDIAKAARDAGFDGILFPSYFSFVRIGAVPFETAYGISIRKLSPLQGKASAQIVPNVALFGRPISDGLLDVDCINRVILRRIDYDFHFGPVEW